MKTYKGMTFEERIEDLLYERAYDAVNILRESSTALRVQEARDEWLRQRLSERDFQEYHKMSYFGPAGSDFPRGWEDAEIQEEVGKIQEAYRQGFHDGARLQSMLMGLNEFPRREN